MKKWGNEWESRKNLQEPTVDLENLPLDRIRDSGW
jgi:hypothetical protein